MSGIKPDPRAKRCNLNVGRALRPTVRVGMTQHGNELPLWPQHAAEDGVVPVEFEADVEVGDFQPAVFCQLSKTGAAEIAFGDADVVAPVADNIHQLEHRARVERVFEVVFDDDGMRNACGFLQVGDQVARDVVHHVAKE